MAVAAAHVWNGRPKYRPRRVTSPIRTAKWPCSVRTLAQFCSTARSCSQKDSTELLRERSEDFLEEGYGQPPRSLDLYLEELEREPTERPPKIMELFDSSYEG